MKFNLQKKDNGWLIGYVIILMAAFIVTFFINNFIFMHVIVTGPSMEDTLHTGDKLWAVRTQNVKVGDVIVFEWDGAGLDDSLIKRVVAVEGETVVRRGAVIKVIDNSGNERIAHTGFAPTSSQWLKTSAVIGRGSVFVMGDNINNSHDSTEFGPIPISSIMAKVI